MSDGTFFANPDFLQYVRHLSELHRLIREGADESPEGEALRDRMDDPGGRLSTAEIASMNGISADFYSLAAPSTEPVLPQREEARADLKSALEARDRGDFSRALELLRNRAHSLDPAILAYIRGTIWAKAGEDRIAVQFFRRATRSDPSDPNGSCAELHDLSRRALDPALADILRTSRPG